MTDEDVEKIIKRNMNLQMNLAGIRADFEEATQRTWIGLTDEDMASMSIVGTYATLRDWFMAVEAKLKEKNQ
jgi:hypothetical protein